jgi:hypothetical protein
MLQVVDGHEVFVVDFDELPQLPITWDKPEDEPYARCLDNAIRTGVITEPGKYGIAAVTVDGETVYQIARIVE